MQDMSAQLSCIIPFYNEGSGLLSLLNTLTLVEGIDEIICVDDGSYLNETGNNIRESFPHVKLITLGRNLGKTVAVNCGFVHTSGEFILLMDADLTGVCRTEIENAIRVMKNDPKTHMIILKRNNSLWYLKALRISTILSGERILHKNDLMQVLNGKVNGYQLEVAINNYMQKNRREVYWMPSSAINTYKVYKSGLLLGTWRDIRMYMQILSYLGILPFFSQVLSFCRKKAI